MQLRLKFVVIQLLLSFAFCNFSIFSPMNLRKELPKIPYAIANFGDIPYGKKMTGRLVLADPIDACKPLNISMLQSSDGSDKTMKFVLIARGNCTFVQKSQQAQLMGAKMAVVYDNVNEVSEQIIMLEDGHGDEINIPTILIPKYAGMQLQNYLQENPKEAVDMSIVFDMWKKETVNYQFWLNIRNRESYKLVRDFKEYALELQDQNLAIFEPKYFLDGRFFIGSTENDCYSDGKYCFKDPDGWGPAGGRDMIDEILRQICIYKINKKKWWDYMDQVDSQCIKPANMKNCGNEIMKQNEIDTAKVNICVERSFIGSVNYLLDKEIDSSKGRAVWPGVTVNNMTYRGNLIKTDILEVVCAALEKEPIVCKKALQNYEIIESKQKGVSKTSLIIVIIIVLFVFFLFLVIFYKRRYYKELKDQMDSRVNPMVNQYIAFYETKKQQKHNDI